jgi:hypothetical protein
VQQAKGLIGAGIYRHFSFQHIITQAGVDNP